MNRLMAGGMGSLQSHMAGRHHEQLMEERNLYQNRVHELEERERKRKEDREKKKKEKKEGKQPEQPPQPGPSGGPGDGGGGGGDGDDYDDNDHGDDGGGPGGPGGLGGLNVPSDDELRRQAKIFGFGGKGPKMKVPESFTGKRDDVTRFICQC